MSDQRLVSFDPDPSGWTAVYWPSQPDGPALTLPVIGWGTYENLPEQTLNHRPGARRVFAMVLVAGEVLKATDPSMKLWKVLPPGERVPTNFPPCEPNGTRSTASLWAHLRVEIPRLIGRENGEQVPYDSEYGTALNDVLDLMKRLEDERS